MKHPAFAFFVVCVSTIIYKRQLGFKVAIKFWWTPLPDYKLGISWKTGKNVNRKKILFGKEKIKKKREGHVHNGSTNKATG